jgi:segregation and condensation protein A
MRSGDWGLRLPQFEGPLDLLLSLIRRNEYDIHDLPISEVTRQYLDYMREAEKVDLDLSSEFAYMAATLIQLKSRSLLPQDPEIASREPDREKEQLVRQLLDHDQVRNGAEFLKQRLELTGASWSRGSGDWGPDEVEGEFASSLPHPSNTLNLLDIVRLAKQALDSARAAGSLDLRDSSPTIEQMMAFLEEELPLWGAVSAGELLAGQPSREHQALLFLALLELAKAEKIQLQQAVPFEELVVSGFRYGTTAP